MPVTNNLINFVIKINVTMPSIGHTTQNIGVKLATFVTTGQFSALRLVSWCLLNYVSIIFKSMANAHLHHRCWVRCTRTSFSWRQLSIHKFRPSSWRRWIPTPIIIQPTNAFTRLFVCWSNCYDLMKAFSSATTWRTLLWTHWPPVDWPLEIHLQPRSE